MKKHLLVVAAATALVPLTSSAQAQSAALLVKGTVSPSACTPTLTNGRRTELGCYSCRHALIQCPPPTCYPKTIDFSIACSAATSIAIRTVDNSAATRVPGIALTREGGVAPQRGYLRARCRSGKEYRRLHSQGLRCCHDGTASLATLVQNGGGAWRLHPGNALMASTSRYTMGRGGISQPQSRRAQKSIYPVGNNPRP